MVGLFLVLSNRKVVLLIWVFFKEVVDWVYFLDREIELVVL